MCCCVAVVILEMDFLPLSLLVLAAPLLLLRF